MFIKAFLVFAARLFSYTTWKNVKQITSQSALFLDVSKCVLFPEISLKTPKSRKNSVFLKKNQEKEL